jgi:methyl-accepting chemotaxis protein-1 (serine sensor receptor)
MNSLKISTRLAMLVGVMTVLMTIVGGLGLYGISRNNDALRTVFEHRTVPAAQLGRIKAAMMRERLVVEMALGNPTPEFVKERIAQVAALEREVVKEFDAYMAQTLTPEEAVIAKRFSQARAAYLSQGLTPALEALRTNDMPAAHALSAGPLRTLFLKAEPELDALVTLQLDEAHAEFDAAVQRYGTIRIVSIAATACGLLFAIVFGYMLARSIVRQLGAEPGEATTLARRVAAGDLSAPIVLRPGHDDSMMAQLATMQRSLVKLVGEVRYSADGVATASTQIAQGNQDLSHRTEEQASTLEQTAASMEELTSSVKQNADNAHSASRLAVDASGLAAEGGAIVGQVVETMKSIDESSTRIADIIGLIDGIAFQTNILALNAAVEAARAGEQGRGFAVVASEVRSLAQRSAGAAKDIKSLIGASVDRTKHGRALVDRAGTKMAEIVAAIERLSLTMSEISASTAEQSEGTNQVGDAVNLMDKATQQNAALVEESAAAAESLRQQAQQLVSLVSTFRLPA